MFASVGWLNCMLYTVVVFLSCVFTCWILVLLCLHILNFTWTEEYLSEDWKAPVYAFFEPVPEITYIGTWRSHKFKCAAKGYKHKCWCYLNTKNRSSTSNMIKHAKSCWGQPTWKAAYSCCNATDARESITKPIISTGSIMAAFQCKGQRKVTYSHCMHTKTETKSVIDVHIYKVEPLSYRNMTTRSVLWQTYGHCPITMHILLSQHTFRSREHQYQLCWLLLNCQRFINILILMNMC